MSRTASTQTYSSSTTCWCLKGGKAHLRLSVEGLLLWLLLVLQLLGLLRLLLPSVLHMRRHKQRHAGWHRPLGHVPHKAVAGCCRLRVRAAVSTVG